MNGSFESIQFCLSIIVEFAKIDVVVDLVRIQTHIENVFSEL